MHIQCTENKWLFTITCIRLLCHFKEPIAGALSMKTVIKNVKKCEYSVIFL